MWVLFAICIYIYISDNTAGGKVEARQVKKHGVQVSAALEKVVKTPFMEASSDGRDITLYTCLMKKAMPGCMLMLYACEKNQSHALIC